MEPSPEVIDFSSYVPYYVPLRELLKGRILAGLWQVGERIPGEVELCREFGVSRTVVRQALLELELGGYIIRRKGRGTFVSGPKVTERLAQKLTGFHQDMLEQGRKPGTRVLSQRLTRADAFLASQLQVPAGATLVEVRRLRLVEDEPIAVVTSFLPESLCPGLEKVDLSERSLYQYLENECRLFIVRAHRSIEAAAASEEDARHLGIHTGDPVILLESLSFLEDGTPLEYFRAYHRGDRARFEIELVRQRDRWRPLEWDPSGDRP